MSKACNPCLRLHTVITETSFYLILFSADFLIASLFLYGLPPQSASARLL